MHAKKILWDVEIRCGDGEAMGKIRKPKVVFSSTTIKDAER